MTKTEEEVKATNRRVNLQEHLDGIVSDSKARDKKNKVTCNRTAAYQDKLAELAYLKSIEGLKTSDAKGYRSQYELLEAIKNHDVGLDP